MKKEIKIIFVATGFILALGLLFLFLTWLGKKRVTNDQWEIIDEAGIVERQFPKGFDSIGVKLEDLLVVRGIERAQDESEFGYLSLQPPIVYAIDKNGNVQDQYEIHFEAYDDNKNGIFTTQEFRGSNLSGNGKEELLSVWTVSWGGSDGLKSLIIWEISDGKLVPKFGYPNQIGTKGLTVKNLKTGETYNFGITNTSTFTHFSENDRLLDFASYFWDLDAGEGHYGPHMWELRRFVYQDGKYIVDESWNGGLLYKTTKKVDYPYDKYNSEIQQLFETVGKRKK